VEFVGDAQVNGQFVAFAQASGDLAAVASGALSDVTNACMGIATDLGDDPTAAGNKTGADALDFWCAEAIAKLNAAAGGSLKGQLSFAIEPPSCSVSIEAQTSCEARCDVNGSCDVHATPPTCKGGTLEISCNGNCTANASSPTFDCTGSCTGMCSGSCQAKGGATVNCNGKCDGHCTAKTGVGNGVQPDGTCQGACDGTCTLAANATVTCDGTCSGKCDATCHAAPGQASVKCSGKCDATATPLSCEGGTLEGGCKVDANCQANCSAGASARAECRPPRVVVTITGSAQGLASAAATLEKNLPALILVAEARGQAVVDLAKVVAGSAVNLTSSGKLDVKGTACVTAAVTSVTQAATDFGAALDKSGTVLVAIGAR
jgi:hypothetical protein